MTPSPPAGRLYIVATPIGNLEDLSPRALRVLGGCDGIAAEDTRRTRKLLSHFRLSVPLISYYKDNEHRRAVELGARLEAGERLALVSDAGMPGVSDPGRWLVREARRRKVPIEVIPGPSALLAALAVSGLEGDAFCFHGFLPSRASARRRALQAAADRPETQVFFLAPHRLREEMRDAAEVLGDGREAALARELTKLHEQVRAGRLGDLAAGELEPIRGEYVLVVAGGSGESGGAPAPAADVESVLKQFEAQGLSRNQAVAKTAKQLGLPRDEVYRRAHRL